MVRTLVQALRQHTECQHALNIGISMSETTAEVRLLHAGGMQTFTAGGSDAVQLGSAIFHECARRIVGDGAGHGDVSLSQPDAEFAGYATNA